MGAVLREVRPQDSGQVLGVCAQGLATGAASFQTTPPDWAGWDGTHLPQPRLVAVDEHDQVLGWAALSPVSNRCAYSGVAKVSIYVAAAARGRGMGASCCAPWLSAANRSGPGRCRPGSWTTTPPA